MDDLVLVILGIVFFFIIIPALKKSGQRRFRTERRKRRDYYRNVYLKSDAWKRKRYVVLKRDNWKCVYCGARATEVHHLKYAKYSIGKEPIKWLVSICRPCHNKLHQSAGTSRFKNSMAKKAVPLYFSDMKQYNQDYVLL